MEEREDPVVDACGVVRADAMPIMNGWMAIADVLGVGVGMFAMFFAERVEIGKRKLKITCGKEPKIFREDVGSSRTESWSEGERGVGSELTEDDLDVIGPGFGEVSDVDAGEAGKVGEAEGGGIEAGASGGIGTVFPEERVGSAENVVFAGIVPEGAGDTDEHEFGMIGVGGFEDGFV